MLSAAFLLRRLGTRNIHTDCGKCKAKKRKQHLQKIQALKQPQKAKRSNEKPKERKQFALKPFEDNQVLLKLREDLEKQPSKRAERMRRVK